MKAVGPYCQEELAACLDEMRNARKEMPCWVVSAETKERIERFLLGDEDKP